MEPSYASLALFAAIVGVSPGPNNIVLLASGMRFGGMRSLPHVIGATAGFTSITVAAACGMAAVFEVVPWASLAMKIVCCAYLVVLAWRIATAGPLTGDVGFDRPLTTLEAAAFQLINPKAWTAGFAAGGTYLGGATAHEIALAVPVLVACLLPTIGLWAILGGWMKHVVRHALSLRALNVGLASLLVLSLYPVVAAR